MCSQRLTSGPRSDCKARDSSATQDSLATAAPDEHGNPASWGTRASTIIRTARGILQDDDALMFGREPWASQQTLRTTKYALPIDLAWPRSVTNAQCYPHDASQPQRPTHTHTHIEPTPERLLLPPPAQVGMRSTQLSLPSPNRCARTSTGWHSRKGAPSPDSGLAMRTVTVADARPA